MLGGSGLAVAENGDLRQNVVGGVHAGACILPLRKIASRILWSLHLIVRKETWCANMANIVVYQQLAYWNFFLPGL